MSFESRIPLEKESKCWSTERYEITREVTEVSKDDTQSSTHSRRQIANPATPATISHSRRQIANPATPATIWLRVQVETNVPIASKHPPCSSRPRKPTSSGFQPGFPSAN